jgi:hypothetical protein
MHYTSSSSFFARAVVLLYSKLERDRCVLRSERDGLFYTGSASNLLIWLSEYRSLYFRPIMHRRPLAIIYCSVSKIELTYARQFVRPDLRARLSTPVILSAAKDRRGAILQQYHGSNRFSPYATGIASLRGDSSAALGMTEKGSRELRRH